jgi:hypothetical protein
MKLIKAIFWSFWFILGKKTAFFYQNSDFLHNFQVAVSMQKGRPKRPHLKKSTRFC